ncbi:hypothetical protein D9758_001676 [Tetrapyrgos nigripes]|uniref:Uncharacterized protein n=1 Tax=Tetrapyrgos nigripes TaxID=182062 RepID=A0A8H5GXV7_9AGAR|nr:hypothetical protein D9758_001676 [Tetrapyrgos nigripes]
MQSFSFMDLYPQQCWPQFSFPPSPTDTIASDLWYSPPSRPQSLHVFCDAPLVAPKPLPYHSPTFLQFDLLPSLDENLSFPPYTRRPPKRKRTSDLESDGHSIPHLLLPVHQASHHGTMEPPVRGTTTTAKHIIRTIPSDRLLLCHTSRLLGRALFFGVGPPYLGTTHPVPSYARAIISTEITPINLVELWMH